jgi:predicted Zn-dependent protease
MNNPITLDDLDRKRKSFCPACREQVAIRSFRVDTIV